jgi:hypothetical protein
MKKLWHASSFDEPISKSKPGEGWVKCLSFKISYILIVLRKIRSLANGMPVTSALRYDLKFNCDIFS